MTDHNNGLSELKEALTQAKESLQEDNERQVVQDVLADAAQGIKAQQDEADQRLARLAQQEVEKALGSKAGSDAIISAVQRAASQRLGRKYVADTGTGSGYQGGGQFIASHKLGEKDSFNGFLCAIGRKDLATVRDIQRAHGITVGYGGRALVEGVGALDTVAGPSGGFLVPPEYSSDLITFLYPYVVLRRAGAQIVTMRSPQFFRPRLSGTSTASYVGETAAIPSSQTSFDQFSLIAKELTALIPVSRLLVQDSDPAVEQIVRDDLSMQLGLAEDKAFLTGAGTTTIPQGLLTRSDIQIITVTNAGSGDSVGYDDIVDMEVLMDAANVPDVRRVWIGHPKLRGALRKVKDGQQRPIFTEYFNPQDSTLLPGRPPLGQAPTATLMGRPFYTSSQLPATTRGSNATYNLALVEMSQVSIGQLGAIELMASDEGSFVDGSNNIVSAWQSNLVLYRGILRSDIAPVHPSAVVVRQGLIAN
jgi:HK97 family phage major capsid protein